MNYFGDNNNFKSLKDSKGSEILVDRSGILSENSSMIEVEDGFSVNEEKKEDETPESFMINYEKEDNITLGKPELIIKILT